MIGLGLEFDIDETIIFGLEGRYYLIETADEVKEAFGKNRMHYMNVMLKIGCRF